MGCFRYGVMLWSTVWWFARDVFFMGWSFGPLCKPVGVLRWLWWLARRISLKGSLLVHGVGQSGWISFGAFLGGGVVWWFTMGFLFV